MKFETKKAQIYLKEKNTHLCLLALSFLFVWLGALFKLSNPKPAYAQSCNIYTGYYLCCDQVGYGSNSNECGAPACWSGANSAHRDGTLESCSFCEPYGSSDCMWIDWHACDNCIHDGNNSPPTGTYMDIGGYVTASDATPLEGVGIYISGGGSNYLVYTDSNGFYNLNDKISVDANTYSVRPANSWIPSGWLSPETAPLGYAPFGKTITISDSYDNCSGSNTPDGSKSYECQEWWDLNDCAGPDGSGDNHRCNFEFDYSCPVLQGTSTVCGTDGYVDVTFNWDEAINVYDYLLRVDYDDTQFGYSQNLWLGEYDWFKNAPVHQSTTYGTCNGVSCSVTLPSGLVTNVGAQTVMAEGNYINYSVQAVFGDENNNEALCTSTSGTFTVPACLPATPAPTGSLAQTDPVPPTTPKFNDDTVSLQATAQDDSGLVSVSIYWCRKGGGINCDSVSDFSSNLMTKNSLCGGVTPCSTSGTNPENQFDFATDGGGLTGTYIFAMVAVDNDGVACFGYPLVDTSANPDWGTRCSTSNLDYKSYNISQPITYDIPQATITQLSPTPPEVPEYTSDVAEFQATATDSEGVSAVSIYWCYTTDPLNGCKSVDDFYPANELTRNNLCSGIFTCQTNSNPLARTFDFETDGGAQVGYFVFAAHARDINNVECFGYDLTDTTSNPFWGARCDPVGNNDHLIYNIGNPTPLTVGGQLREITINQTNSCSPTDGVPINDPAHSFPLGQVPDPYYAKSVPYTESHADINFSNSTFSAPSFGEPMIYPGEGRICADPVINSTDPSKKYVLNCINSNYTVYPAGIADPCTDEFTLEAGENYSLSTIIGYVPTDLAEDGWYSGYGGDIYAGWIANNVLSGGPYTSNFSYHIGGGQSSVFGLRGIRAIDDTAISEADRYIDFSTDSIYLGPGLISLEPPPFADTLSFPLSVGGIYKATAAQFQNFINNNDTYPIAGGPGVAVLYITESDLARTVFTKAFKPSSPDSRLLIITKGEIEFDRTLGEDYATWITKDRSDKTNAQIQAAFIAEDSIVFESYVLLDDKGLQIEGPIVSFSDIWMDRSFGDDNVNAPVVVVTFNNDYARYTDPDARAKVRVFNTEWELDN